MHPAAHVSATTGSTTPDFASLSGLGKGTPQTLFGSCILVAQLFHKGTDPRREPQQPPAEARLCAPPPTHPQSLVQTSVYSTRTCIPDRKHRTSAIVSRATNPTFIQPAKTPIQPRSPILSHGLDKNIVAASPDALVQSQQAVETHPGVNTLPWLGPRALPNNKRIPGKEAASRPSVLAPSRSSPRLSANPADALPALRDYQTDLMSRCNLIGCTCSDLYGEQPSSFSGIDDIFRYNLATDLQ